MFILVDIPNLYILWHTYYIQYVVWQSLKVRPKIMVLTTNKKNESHNWNFIRGTHSRSDLAYRPTNELYMPILSYMGLCTPFLLI
jgi:hypothetical protein